MRISIGRLIVLGAALATLAALVPVAPASAKTYVVSGTGDPAPGGCKPGDCSLREAVRAANRHKGRDTVVLPGRGRYELTRGGRREEAARTGDLDLRDPIVIRHPGRGLATIDANKHDRVLHVFPGARAKLIRLKITGGGNPAPGALPRPGAARRGDPGEDPNGAGIRSMAPVTLVRTTVADNHGARSGGGIYADAKLTLRTSRVSANSNGDSTGAGIFVVGAVAQIAGSTISDNHSQNNGGGVTIVDGELTIRDTTVSDNFAEQGAAGVFVFQSTALIDSSTISSNDAGFSRGGGISETGGPTVIVNSTIAGNRADGGGGGIESSLAGGGVTLRSSTVVGNDGDADDDDFGDGGGGLLRAGIATFEVVNSVIALNKEGADASDCEGTFSSLGGNVLTTTADCAGFSIGTTDLLTATPKLGALKRNGGPTRTIALLTGSPAIGFAVATDLPAGDQRGVLRLDGDPDSGAFEAS